MFTLLGVICGAYIIYKIFGDEHNKTLLQKVILLIVVFCILLSFDFIDTTIVLLKSIEGLDIAIQFWLEESKIYIIFVSLYLGLILLTSGVSMLYCRSDLAKKTFYNSIKTFSRQLETQIGMEVKGLMYSFENKRSTLVIGIKVAEAESSLAREVAKKFEKDLKDESLKVYLYEETDTFVKIYINKEVELGRSVKMAEILLFMINASWNKEVWGR